MSAIYHMTLASESPTLAVGDRVVYSEYKESFEGLLPEYAGVITSIEGDDVSILVDHTYQSRERTPLQAPFEKVLKYSGNTLYQALHKEYGEA
jgi:hypothetical protein